MQHVDEGLLHAWLDGERAALGPARAEEVRRHLEGCAECRTRLGEARDLRDRADALLRGGGPVGVEIPPFESLAGRVPARRSRTRTLAWAASLVLAVSAGWLARGAPDPGEPAARTAAAPRPSPSPVVPMAPAAAAPARTTEVVPATPAESAPAREATPLPLPRVAARADVPAPQAADVAAMEAAPVPPPPPPPAASAEALRVEETRVQAPAAPPSAAPGASGQVQTRSVPLARRAERAAAREPRTDDPVPGAGEPVAAGTAPATGALAGRAPGVEVTRADVLDGAAGPDAEGWLGVRPEAARGLLGREPLRIRGLALVSIQAGMWEGRAAVRVRQRLAGGEILSLVQVPDRAGEESEFGDGAPVSEARDGAPAGHTRLVRHAGGIVVTASAPLPADSLARLLERLR